MPIEININDKRKGKIYSKYNSISRFPEPYFNAVKYTGSVNTTLNNDGHVTLCDHIVTVNDKNYPSLALAMYSRLNNVNEITISDNKITFNNTPLAIPVFQSSAFAKKASYISASAALIMMAHSIRLRNNLQPYS